MHVAVYPLNARTHLALLACVPCFSRLLSNPCEGLAALVFESVGSVRGRRRMTSVV
ncbi:hypothetical protein HBI56_189240 [Parastagonospora nodorum]|uniref:Uncharacterized protein n=1 Tax=Phaeosphaeria nodorum (strain SN15 / ATCC MYA-4574 / FGSC 10173) TaxID=321614 RepID=A0A7U2I673_PHANO|nr:hypothetical protein HBH56_145240 [Parastagonospora nodorum]QRD01342.1 hypothetical protein JI435_416460 [Parastagonospora nodorum SN15]KAH3927745.1 hypothetical protein HBH54_150430 [Parastagonospora nodorum]KAH3947782.1 hypothetical protein HBH53_110450 [Parastagonospora nodorum]KAH3960115.1 hypothetical protein HBH51_194290 [Parastagonospora nodorum]